MAVLFRSRMAEYMEKDVNGRLKMTLTLPDASALDPLAEALARIVMMRDDLRRRDGRKGAKKPALSRGVSL